MTVKPTDFVVRLIELKAKDGLVGEAKLDAKRVAENYEAVLLSLGQSNADQDAVATVESYRALLARLQIILDL